jgi:two-component system response regulator
MSSDNLKVLLVEDDPADVLLTRRILDQSPLSISLTVVSDGEEALDYCFKRRQYYNATLPDLVLLDLNLPKKGGLEVLKEIRSHVSLATLPVIILTTSKSAEDIAQSYEDRANCFVTKPVDLNRFSKVIRAIEEFWLTVVKLPSRT